MIKVMKKGFTLSEALITLTIIGAVATLVLPGIIKDLNSKADISLLLDTVSQVDGAIQQEIAATGATTLEGTGIFNTNEKPNNTKDFFNKRFDTIKVYKEDGDIDREAWKYKTLKGEDAEDTLIDETTIWAQLKNGVYIGLTENNHLLYIDINGPKAPNIIGKDLFSLQVADAELPLEDGETAEKNDISNLGTLINAAKGNLGNCKNGKLEACYPYLEINGFEAIN